MLFFFNDTATTEIYTLSLHDALPICPVRLPAAAYRPGRRSVVPAEHRSEEHTSELQSRSDLVCRLLLEKKKKNSEPEIDKQINKDQHQLLRAFLEMLHRDCSCRRPFGARRGWLLFFFF